MIRYLTAGESHGKALIGIIEGIPAGVAVDSDYINYQLWRRQQGYGRGGRMKIETDQVAILSGVRFGKTIGSPIALMIQNKDWQNWTDRMAVDGDGSAVEKVTVPRPGHADYAGAVKYGFDDIRNVIDRSSARETAMRVAVCSVARKLLEDCGITIGSHVLSIGTAAVERDAEFQKHLSSLSVSDISTNADKSEVRMLDTAAEKKAIEIIKNTKKQGDTVGGMFEIRASGLPVGLGSYVHADRRLSAQITETLMSIQAVKGVEIGDGFTQSHMFGSEVHDEFTLEDKKLTRATNRAGGLEGGMTNGQMLILHAVMKPISSLVHPLKSVDITTGELTDSRYERSDVCAVPAASVVGEAVIAPILANALLEKYGGDSLAELRSRYLR